LKNTGRCVPDKGYGNGCIQVLHLMDKNSSKYVVHCSSVLGSTTLDVLQSPSRLIASKIKLSYMNLMADGSLRGGINREGIRYYNNLINELMSKGIHSCLD
jgi:beta-glucosidase/6-phospho-beta-glucosidase/beta-galactosidase